LYVAHNFLSVGISKTRFRDLPAPGETVSVRPANTSLRPWDRPHRVARERERGPHVSRTRLPTGSCEKGIEKSKSQVPGRRGGRGTDEGGQNTPSPTLVADSSYRARHACKLFKRLPYSCGHLLQSPWNLLPRPPRSPASHKPVPQALRVVVLHHAKRGVKFACNGR